MFLVQILHPSVILIILSHDDLFIFCFALCFWFLNLDFVASYYSDRCRLSFYAGWSLNHVKSNLFGVWSCWWRLCLHRFWRSLHGDLFHIWNLYLGRIHHLRFTCVIWTFSLLAIRHLQWFDILWRKLLIPTLQFIVASWLFHGSFFLFFLGLGSLLWVVVIKLNRLFDLNCRWSWALYSTWIGVFELHYHLWRWGARRFDSVGIARRICCASFLILIRYFCFVNISKLVGSHFWRCSVFVLFCSGRGLFRRYIRTWESELISGKMVCSQHQRRSFGCACRQTRRSIWSSWTSFVLECFFQFLVYDVEIIIRQRGGTWKILVFTDHVAWLACILLRFEKSCPVCNHLGIVIVVQLHDMLGRWSAWRRRLTASSYWLELLRWILWRMLFDLLNVQVRWILKCWLVIPDTKSSFVADTIICISFIGLLTIRKTWMRQVEEMLPRLQVDHVQFAVSYQIKFSLVHIEIWFWLQVFTSQLLHLQNLPNQFLRILTHRCQKHRIKLLRPLRINDINSNRRSNLSNLFHIWKRFIHFVLCHCRCWTKELYLYCYRVLIHAR